MPSLSPSSAIVIWRLLRLNLAGSFVWRGFRRYVYVYYVYAYVYYSVNGCSVDFRITPGSFAPLVADPIAGTPARFAGSPAAGL